MRLWSQELQQWVHIVTKRGVLPADHLQLDAEAIERMKMWIDRGLPSETALKRVLGI